MQNVHPLFVHFPVALLFTATVAVLAGFVVRTSWIAPFARACLYLGTLAAAAAVISGFFAAQTVARVAAAEHALGEHQTFGYVTLAVAAILSAWSIVAWRRSGRSPRPAAGWAIGNLALLVLLFLAAKEGGELVHEYGVGTTLTGPHGPLFQPGRMHPGGSGEASEGAGGARDSVPTARDFR